MIKSAEFSECGKYRYVLTRIWHDSKKIAMCIGLNPSTANEGHDDPTILRLISTLDILGYGGLKMTNLYGLISSKPEALQSCPDPLKENDKYLLTTAHTVQDIIFCWGTFKQAEYRARKVIQLFPDGKCFGKNKNGSPWHPLAMMYKGLKANQAKLTFFVPF